MVAKTGIQMTQNCAYMLPLPRCAMKHSCQPTLMTTAGPNDVIPNTSSAQNPVMAKATVSHGCGTVVKKDATVMDCLFVSLDSSSCRVLILVKRSSMHIQSNRKRQASNNTLSDHHVSLQVGSTVATPLLPPMHGDLHVAGTRTVFLSSPSLSLTKQKQHQDFAANQVSQAREQAYSISPPTHTYKPNVTSSSVCLQAMTCMYTVKIPWAGELRESFDSPLPWSLNICLAVQWRHCNSSACTARRRHQRVAGCQLCGLFQ